VKISSITSLTTCVCFCQVLEKHYVMRNIIHLLKFVRKVCAVLCCWQWWKWLNGDWLQQFSVGTSLNYTAERVDVTLHWFLNLLWMEGCIILFELFTGRTETSRHLTSRGLNLFIFKCKQHVDLKMFALRLWKLL